MNDPGRLREGAQGLERALLQVGAGTRSSPRTRKKVLAALGLSTSWVAGLATAATAKMFGSKLSLTGSVLGAAAVVAIPSVVFFGRPSPRRPEVRANACVDCENPAAPQPAGLEPAVVQPAVAPPLLLSRASDETLVPRTPPRVRGRRAVDGWSSESLAAELAVIDRVRGLLARHHPAEALKDLDRHQRRYTAALLGPEAEVLRIEALADVGRRDEAAVKARTFVAAHPGSLLARRVKSYLPPR